jgi:transcriptional regulator with XRE-family HTH domain
MTFSERLKSARTRLGITQSEMAALLGVSARVYWDWESGKTEPAEITQEGAMARVGNAQAMASPPLTPQDHAKQ